MDNSIKVVFVVVLVIVTANVIGHFRQVVEHSAELDSIDFSESTRVTANQADEQFYETITAGTRL